MRMERALEKAMAIATIAALLREGFFVTVFDGEESVLKRSRDADAILAAMFSTDEDALHVYKAADGPRYGWIRFIYGNDGPDVINDYSMVLESVLAPVCGIQADSVSSRLERGDFRIVFD